MALWDYPTNFSNGSTINSVGALLQYGSYVTEGWFAYAFLLVIFIIVFSVGVMIDARKATLAASFVTFIFSVYFIRLSMINPVVSFALIAIILAAVIFGGDKGRGM